MNTVLEGILRDYGFSALLPLLCVASPDQVDLLVLEKGQGLLFGPINNGISSYHEAFEIHHVLFLLARYVISLIRKFSPIY